MLDADVAQGSVGDRAGASYWNDLWSRRPEAMLVDPRASGPWNFPNREVEAFLRSHLEATSKQTPKARALELGCARSMWLPYLASTLGFQVTGIDYSPEGCAQSRQLLSLASVDAEVICADFFSPPEHLLGAFDLVFSYGVVEHFDDTNACIANFSRYLAPGGLLVTIIPNMTGAPGFLQRKLNKPVFDKHVPLRAAQLERAYHSAGLVVKDRGYLVSANPGVINLEGLKKDASWLAKKAFVAALSRLSLLGWYFEEHVARLPTWGATAAYVHCVGNKPGVGALGT